jgi:hypothetical protein
VLLANDAGDRPNFGTVVAVGEGKKDGEGKQVAPNVSVGATVMYSKYSGTEFEVGLFVCCTGQGRASAPVCGAGGWRACAAASPTCTPL